MFAILLFLIVQTSRFVNGNFHCVGTCYSGPITPKPEDIFQNKYIGGHSYKNITTNDPRKCYSSCASDCRCKACQMKDGRCELLDRDHRSCNLDLLSDTGYVYYDLIQTQYQGLPRSHMTPPNICDNGCCQSQPCSNGGKCQEQCENPKQKYICQCPIKYTGSVCERLVSSCSDIAMNPPESGSRANGKYTIYRSDNSELLDVYCDFTTPNQTWTLIESFAYRYNGAYRFHPLHKNHPKNVKYPLDWKDYRLPLDTMKYLRTKSTLFRSTCEFHKRVGGKLTPDYLLGSLNDYDIINDIAFTGCKTYKYINIRTYEYFNQPAKTFHGSSEHIHIDEGCGFTVPDKLSGEEFFAWYDPPNRQFSCTSTTDSTTQWWLGDTTC